MSAALTLQAVELAREECTTGGYDGPFLFDTDAIESFYAKARADGYEAGVREALLLLQAPSPRSTHV